MDEELEKSFVKRMRQWNGDIQDEEVSHGKGDDLLCELLRILGYGAVVDEWDKIRKWYA